MGSAALGCRRVADSAAATSGLNGEEMSGSWIVGLFVVAGLCGVVAWGLNKLGRSYDGWRNLALGVAAACLVALLVDYIFQLVNAGSEPVLPPLTE